MYELIEEHRSPRTLYTEQLVKRADITKEEAEAALRDFRGRLDAAFAETHPSTPPESKDTAAAAIEAGRSAPTAGTVSVDTSVDRGLLEQVLDGLTRRPAEFSVHPKLERILQAHRTAFESDQVDWALAEAFALGSVVLEGVPVRLAGQDTRRGTFSQRHGVLVDTRSESEYIPLAHLSPEQAPFMLYDSVLSEYAALGFEYGYSVANPDALVLWEAQFGDFVNGGQIVIDQFVVAAEDKWSQHSSLGLLLPHGFEGQGPEHSSARIERFLALCADDNLRVVYPSTAAQYFHTLRRQALASRRVPLVCFTPKRYLRVAGTKSAVAELTSGRLQLVLDDRAALDRAAVRRVLVCTGKVAHELMDKRDELGAPAAVVRVEQLYPWPANELHASLASYPNATEVWWVQEEPANMGAWGFVGWRLVALLDGRDLRPVTRDSSASPATGSQTVHEREQQQLLATAFAGLA
jgi:2-oxoglutarate dehydrogenase complex dehydrogenase (E1) component-like enzyme